MKVLRYDPILADWGEPDMEERLHGDYVTYYEYNTLLQKFKQLKKENKAILEAFEDEYD